MTLNEIVLRKAVEWRPKENERSSLIIPDEGSGWAVALTADRNDDVTCIAWEVALRRSVISENAGPEQLESDGVLNWGRSRLPGGTGPARQAGPTAKIGHYLEAWANRVAARVTGLAEPLKVVEVDEQRREALLRSIHPTQRGNAVRYHEVLLKGAAEAVVRRFQGYPQDLKHREQVAFPLTHEGLAKLAADLAADE